MYDVTFIIVTAVNLDVDIKPMEENLSISPPACSVYTYDIQTQPAELPSW